MILVKVTGFSRFHVKAWGENNTYLIQNCQAVTENQRFNMKPTNIADKLSEGNEQLWFDWHGHELR